jgi:hypothetical protein
VPFDAQYPSDDARAEMLIQYLVRPGYAEVRTEEREPWQYRYWIRVAWDRLRELAAEAGPRPRGPTGRAQTRHGACRSCSWLIAPMDRGSAGATSSRPCSTSVARSRVSGSSSPA